MYKAVSMYFPIGQRRAIGYRSNSASAVCGVEDRPTLCEDRKRFALLYRLPDQSPITLIFTTLSRPGMLWHSPNNCNKTPPQLGRRRHGDMDVAPTSHGANRKK